MAVLIVVFKITLRLVIAFVVGLASFIPALFVGAFGRGSSAQPLIWVCGAVFVTGIGWSLLPLVRHSRRGWHASLAIWLAFGAYLCFFFGAESVIGWAAGPWLLASFALGVALATNPPQYWNFALEDGAESSSDRGA
jgi:hypothetical protein